MSKVTKWSKYQDDIFEVSLDGKNLIIQAAAGSGKTTTIREIYKLIKKRSLVLSFNKSIQRDNENHFDHCHTFHSYGLKLLKKKFPNKCKIDYGKAYTVITKMYENLSWEGHTDRGFVYALLRFLNSYRSKYYKYDNVTIEKAIEASELTSSSHAKVNPGLIKARRKFLYNNIDNVKKIIKKLDDPKIIDMLDMVRLPAIYSLYKKLNFEALIVDEVQDLDIMQLKCMVDFHKGRDNQVIFAGDRCQSIYGFRGAYEGSMDYLRDKLNLIEMPLPITYRCHSNIVNYVNVFLEKNKYDLRVEHFNNGGEVNAMYGKHKDLANFINEKDEKDENISMIISAKNSNLIRLYFDLKLQHGYLPNLKGVDIATALKEIFEKYNCNTISQMKSKVSELIITLESKEDLSSSLLDTTRKTLSFFDTVLSVMVDYDFSTVRSLHGSIKTDSKKVTDIDLFTVHASKGLEGDRIVVLNDWFVSDQMVNMQYVAFTRAKSELIVWDLTANEQMSEELI